MFKKTKSKLENTIFEAKVNESGEFEYYRIRPEEGYKLHVKSLDEIILDADGNETDGRIKGYTNQYTTAGLDYDFEKNEREIYAVKEGSGD